MTLGTPFSTDVNGTNYSARFHLSGRRIVVLSIYGERGARLGAEMPLPVAQRLLGELVQRRIEEKAVVARALAGQSAALH